MEAERPAPALVPPRIGTASVLARASDGRSEIHRARSSGPLRLLFPRAEGDAAWVVMSSLGGGLVDGDRVALDLTIDRDATCLLTTQSSSKVYRGRSTQDTRVRVSHGGTALMLPDPIAPFRDAHFTQTTRVDLDPGASLVYCDAFTAGRVAHGERWESAHLDVLLSIRVGDTCILHDRVLLDPRHGSVAERLGRFEAIGTVALLGPRCAAIATRALTTLHDTRVSPHANLVMAGSSIGDGILVRVAATNVQLVVDAMRELVREACATVGEAPWARKW